MRIIIHILSALALIPLVIVLAYFGFIGLMGAIKMTFICWGLALWFVISIIESPNTDNVYYCPMYTWLTGLIMLIVAPFLHWLLAKKACLQR